jgi:hypothetical protein
VISGKVEDMPVSSHGRVALDINRPRLTELGITDKVIKKVVFMFGNEMKLTQVHPGDTVLLPAYREYAFVKKINFKYENEKYVIVENYGDATHVMINL